MTEPTHTTTATDPKAAKRLFLLIVGIPLAVILFSSGLYFLADGRVVDLGTVNRGELITPARELAGIELRDAKGEALQLFRLAESKWLYAVVALNHCGENCERMIYLTRQTHTALGKRSPRVARILIQDEASPPLPASLLEKYPDLTVVRASGAAINKLLGDATLGSDPGFYVVDPLGWLMMKYKIDDLEQATLNQLGKDVLKDMRRLLR